VDSVVDFDFCSDTYLNGYQFLLLYEAITFQQVCWLTAAAQLL